MRNYSFCRWPSSCPLCKESDAYGNCKSETVTKSVSKGGKVEEVTEVTVRAYTYY